MRTKSGKRRILVTGGTGYIGSHTCLELLEAGYEVTALDNLCNSSEESLARVKELAGRELDFEKADLLDPAALKKVFSAGRLEAVIHFAALKAVGESWQKPLLYFRNNITGTINLLDAMAEAGVKSLVFSSSATVYGAPDSVPVREDFPLRVTNPYGRTKLVMEDMIRDIACADKDFRSAVLRYFNPIGAHESGRIGEDPRGVPNNLLPYVTQVAVGKLKELPVFGDDYPTRDGTGVRDYIHVVDLAKAHVRALEKLAKKPGVVTYNLGTGRGYSVLEIIRAFEKASGRKIPCKMLPRRPGDVAECYADPAKANLELGWRAERGIEEMCRDAWKWQSANPDGYVAGPAGRSRPGAGGAAASLRKRKAH